MRKSKNNMTEKALEKRIILTLKVLGFYVYKTTGDAGAYDYNMQFNEAGMADLIVIGEGNVAFLEVKAPDGKQSIKQKVFQEICEKHGVIYRVVRSMNEALEAIRGGKTKPENG